MPKNRLSLFFSLFRRRELIFWHSGPRLSPLDAVGSRWKNPLAFIPLRRHYPSPPSSLPRLSSLRPSTPINALSIVLTNI
jgi:hypothetical protein